MSRLLVSAGLIRDGSPYDCKDSRVLVTRRLKDAHLAGYWEFPGGKVEAGEDPVTALARELDEELGIQVRVGDIYAVGHHVYPSREVILLVYDVEIESGAPECREVAEMQWITLADLLELELPPADKPVLERIRRDIYT